MVDLHPTEVEIVAEAYYHLTSGGAAFPVKGALDDINDVVKETDNSIPAGVVHARDALEAGDADAAQEHLEDFLRDTDYEGYIND